MCFLTTPVTVLVGPGPLQTLALTKTWSLAESSFTTCWHVFILSFGINSINNIFLLFFFFFLKIGFHLKKWQANRFFSFSLRIVFILKDLLFGNDIYSISETEIDRVTTVFTFKFIMLCNKLTQFLISVALVTGLFTFFLLSSNFYIYWLIEDLTQFSQLKRWLVLLDDYCGIDDEKKKRLLWNKTYFFWKKKIIGYRQNVRSMAIC